MINRTLLIFFLVLAFAVRSQDNPDETANAGVAIEQETNPGKLLAVAAQAQAAKDYSAMERAAQKLVQLRPQIGAYHYVLAKSYALQDKKPKAYSTLLAMNGQGLSFDLDPDPDFDNLRNYQLYEFIQDGFARNKESNGVITQKTVISGKNLLIDGLAYDSAKKRILAGSIVEGRVFVIDETGRKKTLVEANEENGLLGVFDLAVDEKRRSLWLTSAAVPHFESIKFQDVGRTGVYEFDLDSGALKSRYEMPVGQRQNLLANLTVAPDGSVYVANSSSPEVYRVDVEKKVLESVFQAPTFTSIRGIATSPDGKMLFFSDYELGLFGVELATQKAFQVRADATINLGGIDAIEWYRDGLILVQNGNIPHRVYRLQLNDSRDTVVKGQVMLVGYPELSVPNEGVVTDDGFLLLANSNANLYDARSGKPLEDSAIESQVLLSVDPDAGWDVDLTAH